MLSSTVGPFLCKKTEIKAEDVYGGMMGFLEWNLASVYKQPMQRCREKNRTCVLVKDSAMLSFFGKK